MENICYGNQEFSKCIKWRVGSRESELWHDKWLDGGALKSQFPRIFAIARHKEAKVWGKWFMVCGGLSYLEPLFQRAFYG